MIDRTTLGSRLAQPLRRIDALAGVAWRAAPGLTIYCCILSLVAGVLGVAYPIGFRIIVNGALRHEARTLVTGVLVVGITFAASWTCRVVAAMAGSRLTDAANLALGDRIGELVNQAPFLEHYERPDYLAQIENLRDQRRTLAGAPRQVLSLAQSAITAIAVIILLAEVYPPVLVVPMLAILPGLADRRASQIQKRSDDDLADARRLLGALFTLASTAAPARELRTFGITDAIRERHARIGDEVNRRSLAAARRSAAWESLG